MTTPVVFSFGVFELDTSSGELRRNGLKIRLPDQSFEILKVLLCRPGHVVTRDELRQVLWTPDTFVDVEVGLNSAVRKLREALDDSAENPRFVETLPRRGYRFVASVSAVEIPVSNPSASAAAAALEPAAEQASEDASRPAPTISTAFRDRAAPTTTRARRSVGLASGLLLLGILLTAGFVYQRGGLAALRPGPAAKPIRSVVVLPFENLIGDAGQQYVVDSVTDAVTAHLAQVAGLDVISRTSARQYTQTGKRVPDIGRELQVDGVVAGTVTRSAGAVRITVQLIRAATDRHVWSDLYAGGLGDMITLQKGIASDIAVAAGLPAAPSSAHQRRQGINVQAYDAYIKGITAFGAQQIEGSRTAVAYFEDAIAIQPDFAEAHAALGQAQLQFLFAGPLSPHQTIPKAEAATRRALQLDENIGRAHNTLGQILGLYYWRWEEGDKALERAAELHQDSRISISNSLIRRGRFQEAIALTERARTLDPLSLAVQVDVGTAYRAAGNRDRAIAELRRALAMSPGHTRVHFQLGVTFVAMGRLDEAIRDLELAARPAHGHNSRIEAYLGYAYAAAGRARDARKVLQELEGHRSEQYVSWFGLALIHDALGEKKPALAALQRAYDDHAVEFGQMDQYPAFKTIADQPTFLAVMRQVGRRR